MPKAKTTYEAEDGKEFDTKEEAERHDKMEAAKRKFEAAAEELNRTLAETCRTADGQPFKLNEDYYIVYNHYNEEGVTWEHLWASDCRVEDNGYGRLEVYRTKWDDKRGKVSDSFSFDNIFADKRKASLRVLEIRKERLGWLQESVEKLESELGLR